MFSFCRKRLLHTDCRQGPFNWVGGSRRDPRDRLGVQANLEPRTGKVLAEVATSGPEEVESAAMVAKEAFTTWSKARTSTSGRSENLYPLIIDLDSGPD